MAVTLNSPLWWESASGDDAAMLDALQPNILKAHTREFLTVLFLRFDDQAAARGFLRKLVGTGSGEGLTPEDRSRKDRLEIWTRILQREGVLAQVVASYEAVPLLTEYAPRVNPQQIKNALMYREEAERLLADRAAPTTQVRETTPESQR